MCTRPLALPLLLLVTFVSASGCGSEKKSAPAPTPAEPTKERAGIKVLDAGREPRRSFRPTSKKGDRFTQIVNVTTSSEVTGAPAPAPDGTAAIPSGPDISLTITMDVAVTDVASDGAVTITNTVTDVNARGAEGTPLTSMFDGLRGITIITTESASGDVSVRSENVDPSKLGVMLSDQVTSMARMGTMAYPFTPIGAGARWETTDPTNATSPRAVSDLVALDGDTATSRSRLVYPEPADSPAGIILSQEAAGEAVDDLRTPLVERATMDLTQIGEQTVNGKAVRTTTKIRTTVDTKSSESVTN